MKLLSNQLAGVIAGCTLEFTEMIQLVRSHSSGSARLLGC